MLNSLNQMNNNMHDKQIIKSLQPQALPLELISDIISRLPVKLLCQFKCVSKTWLSLISSPHFIKCHLHFSCKTIKKQENVDLILGYTYHSDRITLYICSLDFLVSYNSIKEVKPITLNFNDDFDSSRKSQFALTIVGSCNGVYCMGIFNDLILWNPSIRKAKLLPQLGAYVPFLIRSFGFVYDELNDDYKVVTLEHFEQENKLIIRSYSLRANSWKMIKECVTPDYFFFVHRSAYIGGNLHWSSLTNNKNWYSSLSNIGGNLHIKRTWVGVSYNPKTEMLGEIKLPYDEYIDSHMGIVCLVCLGVLKGCLCTIQSFSLKVDIWIMKNYGESESWTKIASFSQRGFNHPASSHIFMWLCELEDDGILLNSGERRIGKWSVKNGVFGYPNIKVEQDVVKFENEPDNNGGTPSHRRVDDFQNYVVIESAHYTESLVCPTVDDEPISLGR